MRVVLIGFLKIIRRALKKFGISKFVVEILNQVGQFVGRVELDPIGSLSCHLFNPRVTRGPFYGRP
jgi:hypothetical protein